MMLFILQRQLSKVYKPVFHITDNDLYDSMKILDPKELPLQKSTLSLYGIEKLKLLCEYFENQKYKSNGIIVQPLINSSECKKEWQMLNVETLDMHLTILLNAPDNIEDFNWNKAFNQWKNEYVRQVNINNV
ncbi:unnamed protein product [Rhizophagus irregularis]|nr:unnamed protein product [Rhizophagus irregularis]